MQSIIMENWITITRDYADTHIVALSQHVWKRNKDRNFHERRKRCVTLAS